MRSVEMKGDNTSIDGALCVCVCVYSCRFDGNFWKFISIPRLGDLRAWCWNFMWEITYYRMTSNERKKTKQRRKQSKIMMCQRYSFWYQSVKLCCCGNELSKEKVPFTVPIVRSISIDLFWFVWKLEENNKIRVKKQPFISDKIIYNSINKFKCRSNFCCWLFRWRN